jgi:DNA repair protein RAD5
MLVLNKATEEDEAEAAKFLDADGNEEQSLKQMIAMYAGGADDDAIQDNAGDTEYAMKVLKDIEESEGCMLCTSEIFDEVLLPCYHRG